MPLVPHPADHAVDQEDRLVPGLARRGERAACGRARVQAFPGLTRDDVGVEVGQQAIRGAGPGSVAVSPARVHPGWPSSSTGSSAPASVPNSPAADRGGMTSRLAKGCGVTGP